VYTCIYLRIVGFHRFKPGTHRGCDVNADPLSPTVALKRAVCFDLVNESIKSEIDMQSLSEMLHSLYGCMLQLLVKLSLSCLLAAML